MKRVVYILALLCMAVNSFAQCTDSVSLAPDSLQWILGNENTAPSPVMARYKDTLYIGGDFSYIGKYTGSSIGLNTKTLELYKQPTWPKSNGTVNDIVPDGKGGIVIVGKFTRVGDSMRNNLAHIDATGKVTTLSANFSDYIQCAAVHNDTVYLGGVFYYVNGVIRERAASLSLVTGQLTNWSPGVHNYILSMVSDGKNLYVAGDFSAFDAGGRTNLASFDLATGALTNWNPRTTGGTSTEHVNKLYIHGNTLYVGGRFQSLQSTPRNNIGAFDLTTGLLTNFNPDADDIITGFAARNGVVYATGYFSKIGGQNRMQVAAIDSATGLATSWKTQIADKEWGQAIAVNSTTVYVAGKFTKVGNERRTNFAAFDINTGAVLNIQANGYGRYWTTDIRSLCMIDTTLFTGGAFASIGGYERMNLAGIDLKNNKIISLKTDTVAYPIVKAIDFSNDTMYVAGDFTSLKDPSGTINGAVPRRHVASYAMANNYALTSFNPLDTFSTFDGYINDIKVRDNHLYIGGNFGFYFGTTQCSTAVRVDKKSGAMDTWRVNIYGTMSHSYPEAKRLRFEESLLFIPGYFIGNINYDGSLAYQDISTGKHGYANFNERVNDVAFHGNKVYAAGLFSKHDTFSRNGLATVDTTAPDNKVLKWNPDAGSGAEVHALAAYKDKIFAGGEFTSIGGQPRDNFAILDTLTGKVWPWKPRITKDITFTNKPTVNNILVMGDTVFVAGNFNDIDGKGIWGISRFHFNNFYMPEVTIKASENPACVGSNVNFSATANASSVIYQWRLNGNKVGINSNTHSYVPNNNDRLTCEIKVVSTGCYAADSGFSNEIKMAVTQKTKPTITVAGPPLVTPGNTVNLTATINNAGSNYNIQWKNLGVIFANTSTPSTSYTKAAGVDMITATIVPADCYDTATSVAHVVQDGVGINDIGLAATVFVYPNPVTHALHIEGISKGTTIKLLDVAGKELYSAVANSNKETINTQNIVPGNYILWLEDSNGHRVTKPVTKK